MYWLKSLLSMVQVQFQARKKEAMHFLKEKNAISKMEKLISNNLNKKGRTMQLRLRRYMRQYLFTQFLFIL